MTGPARPFADAVLAYAQAGWTCIMPVPINKHPPPVGFTGAEGRDTDPMQLATWAGTHAEQSIALRMPDGVIGIDVDQYEKAGVQKHGGTTFEAHLQLWSPLPATWSSTARGRDQPSRILFYRVPPGRYTTKLAGGDVEIIQRHHRYAVVWPSPHLDTGTLYRWYDPAGQPSELPPKPDELPELPEAWVAGLREGATEPAPGMAAWSAGDMLLRGLLADERPACAEIASAVLTAVAELGKVDAGSRHDTATARVHQLVQLSAAGHPGLGRALPDLAVMWAELTAGEDREAEWERMLLTSARKAVTAVGARQVANDPCLLIGTIPVAAPAPDLGADPAEPIEPPRELHPRQVIGAHLFDPRGFLDQTLAQAVLERTYPVLRYAYDANTWLLRGPETWGLRKDLAEWAIALVADLMPHGDPDAEKGSDARDQAERRKRFMSAAPSSAIARKARALVAGGVHPCALKITGLDREPWLLWAGGCAWDLRASCGQPTQALIDPSTPHLHAAGVAPETRPTPLWDAFTAAVWPDPELRAWALRVLSIALTGYSDKALPILIGEKDRGKTQVVALIMSVLGSYAHAADARLLSGIDNAHASIVYALMGRRLSFIDEGPRDGRLGQERLKQLTGGGELTGNQMNANPDTFRPTHTLVLTANDEPLLTDPAVRGRARLIPCEGDPAQVIAARAAIGHPSDAAWRKEAPGVLAAMMREAGAWLADRSSGLTAAAPEAFRYRGEQIAAEQDPIGSWLEDEVEVDEPTRSRVLYEAFVGWCRNGNTLPSQIPTETKWGRELTRRGHPVIRHSDGNYRALTLRPRGGWFPPTPREPSTPAEPARSTEAPECGGSADSGWGVVKGSAENGPAQKLPENPGPQVPGNVPVEGMEGTSTSYAHTHVHDARVRGQGETYPPPSKPPTQPFSAQIAERLLAARDQANLPAAERQRAKDERTVQLRAERAAETARRAADSPKAKTDDDVLERRAEHAAEMEARAVAKRAQKASAKAEALAATIAAAAGEPVTLPAVVTRDGAVRPIKLGDVGELVLAFGMLDELTVDVETSGYPIGHADYELRTVQLGNSHAAVVFDAHDQEHCALAERLLRGGILLHAHSATADLVPLAIAGVVGNIDDAWDRMHDTVIPAKLADPSSTGSDPALKQLAGAVLGEHAAAPSADAARAALFKAGKWLTDTKPTTPLDRSGWAQVDPRCTTMVRYAACDVLDTAALAGMLPAVPPAVLARERTAQRMTATVAYRGVRLDGEHVDAKLPEHRAALAEAGGRLSAFGIANPGSDQQVAAKLTELGASLPRTKTGRASVAKGALEGFKHAEGQVGDLVRARLDYQHHETVLGLFLEPYAQLVHRGDGRARPTVYTLGADTGRMSCLSMDAMIEMPRDLAKYPGGVPIIEVQAGDWVYAFDHERELVLKRVKWCAQTGVRQTLIITAQNGEGHKITLRATPDHLIRLRNGDWRAVGKLLTTSGARRDGVRLMPMVRRVIDDGYVKFFPHSIARLGAGVKGGGKSREHRWVLERIEDRKISTKADVNHIDGSRANNHPSNLQALPIEEHRGNRDLAWGVEQPDLALYAGPTDYRVISVEPGLVEPVWDMEVEDVHNFIANGICVHNCVRPNLQQVPRQGGIRSCITADPGGVIVSADFAGVEVRVAAALSGDPSLARMLAQDVDLHWLIARDVYGPDATKEDRYNTKRGVFGRLYGSGIPGIARTLGISDAKAAATVEVLDGYTPQLAAFTASLKRAVQNGMTTFETYSGRVIHLDQRLPHKALNYCVQGTARELLIDTLVRWADTRWRDCVLMPVHDEVLVFVPQEDAEEATAALVAAMQTQLFGVAIKAEASEPSFAWKDAS